MTRLWVDDLREPPEGWTWTKTVTEAIRILATQDVTEVSLDHDISHVVKPKEWLNIPQGIEVQNSEAIYAIASRGTEVPISCMETFEPVAWFLAYCPFGVRNVRIHTASPVAADRIKNIFEQVSGHGIEVEVRQA